MSSVAPPKSSAPREPKPVRVVACETPAEVEQLKSVWTELLESTDYANAFLSWEWLYTWIECYVHSGRRVFVLVVWEGQRAIGLAPLYVRRGSGPFPVRALGFLGLPESGSDYMDFIARKGKEALVTQAIVDALFGQFRSRWDMLTLQELPSDSKVLASLLLHLRRGGKHYTLEDGSFCPRISLPESFEAYLASLSGHRRQQYRRELKMLFSAEAVEHRIVTEPNEVERWLPAFRRLYEARWGADAGELFAFIQAYRRRTGDAAVELSLLLAGERLIAGLLHLPDGGAKRMYLMAVDREFNPAISLGNLMCGLNIEDAAKSGFKVYDFLKGDESYKTLWMNGGRRAVHLTIHNRTLPSLASYVAKSAKGFGKILVRSR